jgi:DNA-binding HxlR family transcriptional regulator
LPNFCSVEKLCHMAKARPGTGLATTAFDSDEIFVLLDDEFRRRVLRRLANGDKTASDLGAGSGMKRHTYFRHLTALCESGVIVQKENPAHGRKPLYSLSSRVVVCQTPNGKTIDVGPCGFHGLL